MPAAASPHRAVRCLVVLGCVAAILGAAGPVSDAAAQTPAVKPSRATVYIRLIGDMVFVRPASAFTPERRFDVTNMPVSTGSGVLISPTGHVLTAAHVLAPATETTWKINGETVAVKRTVRRFEVTLPPDEGAARPAAALEATVLATDTALDLAVLSVSGSNLPFVDLGDSDALGVGDPVEALGFPFGDDVEIGKVSFETGDVAPSVSRGNVAAVRGDDQGNARYVQVTAALNPGNSGGPIVDGDGYVVAIANSVIRSRAGVGAGVGFGVPVNLVRRFLEANGLDSALRARRLAPGGLSPLEGKGLRLALPIGMTDASPYRTRVDTGQQPDGLAFHADRFVSPWPLARLESALVSSRVLEPFVASTSPISQTVDTPGGRVLIGRVSGTLATTGGDGDAASGTPARMDYAIAQRGGERVIARFIGPPYQLAYNASLLRRVLQQMEVDALRQPSARLQPASAWAARSVPRGTPLDQLPLPSGWRQEPAGPLPCTGVPPAVDVVSASPAGDFSVALRAGWIASPATTPQAAAARCGTPGGDDRASYTREFAFLGTSYVLEGRFAPVPGQGVLQTEGIAPADQAATMRALFAAWPPPTTPLASRSR